MTQTPPKKSLRCRLGLHRDTYHLGLTGGYYYGECDRCHRREFHP